MKKKNLIWLAVPMIFIAMGFTRYYQNHKDDVAKGYLTVAQIISPSGAKSPIDGHEFKYQIIFLSSTTFAGKKGIQHFADQTPCHVGDTVRVEYNTITGAWHEDYTPHVMARSGSETILQLMKDQIKNQVDTNIHWVVKQK